MDVEVVERFSFINLIFLFLCFINLYVDFCVENDRNRCKRIGFKKKIGLKLCKFSKVNINRINGWCLFC